MMIAACTISILLQQPLQQKQDDQKKYRHNANRTYQQKDLQIAKLKLKDKHEINAWVMDTFGKRQEGMMFLENKDFTEKEGMIFVFKTNEYQRFWMRNTLVDLDVAYITATEKGNVINSIYTMKSLDETTDYSSRERSKYVLEVKAGLFKKLGVKVGDKVEIPKTVIAKQ